MHRSEIDHEARVQAADVDFRDSAYGDRPVALEGFAMVDDMDLLVPVDGRNPEAVILVLTRAQAMEMTLTLAGQIGRDAALKVLEESDG